MKKNSVLATLGAVLLAAVAAFYGIDLGSSGQPSPLVDDLEVCEVASLPAEAEPVIADILSGGPYEYPGEDGGHFGNYEGLLPEERGSYYRSYTVDTPGMGHRGPKRIVVGGGTETDPEVWYYSGDHYESFCVIPDAED
ncbi:guanyl-specific ribonuclease [Corynebacterium humireducens NBRC 106098 = DSM 45392]|uniref:Guanyl-specific ribonuclease n=1 Tax=Corynebacterium humireducens NBRC 106098 = DSM 45392 TaxID=1223515 RepID=A0A0B5D9P3_9CORY|nr:ribonuclease domain-containing protein [Corynebacterium humireducens]AJE33722.1 guanyl-specific ribonuclease [Corynebacterium humireducens NBRC 106098 = DSM 45392]